MSACHPCIKPPRRPTASPPRTAVPLTCTTKWATWSVSCPSKGARKMQAGLEMHRSERSTSMTRSNGCGNPGVADVLPTAPENDFSSSRRMSTVELKARARTIETSPYGCERDRVQVIDVAGSGVAAMKGVEGRGILLAWQHALYSIRKRLGRLAHVSWPPEQRSATWRKTSKLHSSFPLQRGSIGLGATTRQAGQPWSLVGTHIIGNDLAPSHGERSSSSSTHQTAVLSPTSRNKMSTRLCCGSIDWHFHFLPWVSMPGQPCDRVKPNAQLQSADACLPCPLEHTDLKTTCVPQKQPVSISCASSARQRCK